MAWRTTRSPTAARHGASAMAPDDATDELLRPELTAQLDSIGRADIVVGIPSYNNAHTIGHVVRAVSAGLAKYYHDCACVVVNADGGSSDGTRDIALQVDTGSRQTLLLSHNSRPLHRLSTGYLGVPGKGTALRAIFAAAARLGAHATAVVDSDLRSISPEWIELLIGPILREKMDYVAPLYQRHKYDGTITNNVVYPLTRALYGQRVRQPIGGDFGMSGSLAAHFLGGEAWETDVARYGIDIWMTTRALADGYRVAQSYLGAKIHDTKDPGADLTAMFTQVIGTVFDLVGRYQQVWRATSGSREVPTFGFRYTVGVEPVQVNVERMINIFRQGAHELMGVWQQMLSAETCSALAHTAAATAGPFDLPSALWVRAVYEAAVSYHRRTLARSHLLKALIPLYLGRTAGFVLQTANAGADDVETEIEALCVMYESLKPYLVERWDRQGAATRAEHP